MKKILIKIKSKKQLLMIICIAGLFGIFIWPTQYHYESLTDGGQTVPVRINRITGDASHYRGNGFGKDIGIMSVIMEKWDNYQKERKKKIEDEVIESLPKIDPENKVVSTIVGKRYGDHEVLIENKNKDCAVKEIGVSAFFGELFRGFLYDKKTFDRFLLTQKSRAKRNRTIIC